MKIVIFVLVLFFSFSISFVFSQNYQPGKLWVSVTTDEARTTEDGFTNNKTLNDILSVYHVDSYKQLMGFAKTVSLRDIYEISCQCNELELKATLEREVNELFSFIEQIPLIVPVYEPDDDFWQDTTAIKWIWHLPIIQADSAWDITRGNPQIKVGIVDQCVDIEHPDLESQTYPHS